MTTTSSRPTPLPDGGAAPTVPPNRIVAVLAIGGIVVAMTQTLVVPIIATLPAIFDAPASDTSWIITITLLVAAVSTPVAGRLGDLYGKKKMLLISLLPLAVGSAVCAVATTVPVMVTGRGLQGLATGFIPLGISMLHDLLPKERTAGAISLMSSSLGIGGAFGLPFAAAVAQFASWRFLFWLITVCAALMAVIIWRTIPAPAARVRVRTPFDYVGVLGLSAGLVALLLAVSKGAEWGWTSPLVLGLFAGSVLVLLAWGWWELRTPAALVDLRTTARPAVLITNLASILVGFAMYAQSLILPQLMQAPAETGFGLGQSMLQMGLWMAPAGIAMTLMSPVGARITRARGPKTTFVLGGLVMSLGYGLSALAMDSLVGLAATAFVASAGVGFAYGAMPALILGSVPADEKAAANGFNALMRSIGTSTAAAVIGVVLARMSTSYGDHTLPTESGFRVALLLGCGVAVVAAALAATIPVRATGTAAGND
ncbi:Major Facilitator Superfamily protein [Promicromonospora umidemergens]|uniref:Major facilitator superfamily (MFS) profile domain-containing protein n=1 Tax=Promicromonospora umidemergens TaxID=629679 RepID=A0ABP8WIL0_9MICO|nr:MFS transporter [Promicromonospora umidemergens]MCP2283867.1 Major Facilitator Superfamily protein [Promicromonospora umidemergens]